MPGSIHPGYTESPDVPSSMRRLNQPAGCPAMGAKLLKCQRGATVRAVHSASVSVMAG
jgi:hypothetical protein